MVLLRKSCALRWRRNWREEWQQLRGQLRVLKIYLRPLNFVHIANVHCQRLVSIFFYLFLLFVSVLSFFFFGLGMPIDRGLVSSGFLHRPLLLPLFPAPSHLLPDEQGHLENVIQSTLSKLYSPMMAFPGQGHSAVPIDFSLHNNLRRDHWAKFCEYWSKGNREEMHGGTRLSGGQDAKREGEAREGEGTEGRAWRSDGLGLERLRGREGCCSAAYWEGWMLMACVREEWEARGGKMGKNIGGEEDNWMYQLCRLRVRASIAWRKGGREGKRTVTHLSNSLASGRSFFSFAFTFFKLVMKLFFN